jgi:hypothetical protein
MLPSVAPAAVLWTRLIRGSSAGFGRDARLGMSLSGYLLTWPSVGAVAFAALARTAPERPVYYFRASSSCRRARSQRRHASAQTRQCCICACCSHSSPQLPQMAVQASSSGRVRLASYSAWRVTTLTVAVQTSTQSRHSRMH